MSFYVILCHSGAILCHSGAILSHSGVILGSFWGHVGAILGPCDVEKPYMSSVMGI